MYEIEFYEDKDGYSDIVQYIKEVKQKSLNSKEERIDLNKIVAYFDVLSEKGTRIGEPVTKHLEGEIWELRPLRHRFLYAYYKDRKFLILHHFIKQTRKTPARELKLALKRLKEYRERNL